MSVTVDCLGMLLSASSWEAGKGQVLELFRASLKLLSRSVAGILVCFVLKAGGTASCLDDAVLLTIISLGLGGALADSVGLPTVLAGIDA